MTESESQAMQLLDEFMAAFNARDLKAWEATFNYPSVRLASGRVVLIEGPGFHPPDMFDRALGQGWHHSAWDHRRVVHSSEDKVHFDTRFTLDRAGRFYQERYWHDVQFDVVEELRRFFDERGRSLAQVALAWVLGRPGVTSAILGASRAEQLRETLPAVDLELTEEEQAFCDQIWYRIPRSSNPTVATR